MPVGLAAAEVEVEAEAEVPWCAVVA